MPAPQEFDTRIYLAILYAIELYLLISIGL